MSHDRVAEICPKAPELNEKALFVPLDMFLSEWCGRVPAPTRVRDPVMEHSDEKETDMAEHVTRRNFMTLLAATATAGTLGSRKKHDS